jgi:hypothetical protein
MRETARGFAPEIQVAPEQIGQRGVAEGVLAAGEKLPAGFRLDVVVEDAHG